MKIKKTKADRTFDIINMIIWIVILFIILYPLWLIIIASLSDPDAVVQGQVLLIPVDFSLMGYEAVFEHSELWNSYLNSVFYTVGGTLLSLVVTMCAAYALTRNFAGKKILQFYFRFHHVL